MTKGRTALKTVIPKYIVFRSYGLFVVYFALLLFGVFYPYPPDGTSEFWKLYFVGVLASSLLTIINIYYIRVNRISFDDNAIFVRSAFSKLILRKKEVEVYYDNFVAVSSASGEIFIDDNDQINIYSLSIDGEFVVELPMSCLVGEEVEEFLKFLRTKVGFDIPSFHFVC